MSLANAFWSCVFFLHPPACGRVGRGSGRGGPSPGLRARLARLAQRESEISRHVFISWFTYPNSFSTVKSATPKSVSEGQSILTRSLAHASGYHNAPESKTNSPCTRAPPHRILSAIWPGTPNSMIPRQNGTIELQIAAALCWYNLQQSRIHV